MKVVSINAVSFGSTGTIMRGIAAEARNENISYYTFSRKIDKNNREYPFHEYYNSINEFWVSEKSIVLTGLEGFFNIFSTVRLISKMKEIKPDIIHLHNLHGWYINLSMLFRYIKRHNIKTVWTLHDCWSFTGHCPHFDMIGCDKWRKGCYKCPQFNNYPRSLFDNSKYMYKFKREWFTGVKNMTIVTPSEWLAGFVKQSFLGDYPVKVINNGIDLNIFKPTESDFRKKYALENKYIVLGVAFGWDKRKGLDVFCEMAQRFDSEKFQIVLVGTDENIDRNLPKNIISIHRTENQKELAEIYTAADVFANPTREENYPTVNMECIACGTPIVTFNTGGSPEILDETCGAVVPKDDINAMFNEIIRICETQPYSKDDCLKRAESFDKNKRFKEYINLYKELKDE